MPSLDRKKTTNNYIISPEENFSFKFDEEELDNIIKASLLMKKNIIYLKNSKFDALIKNEECLENNDEFLFIPHRLKKQFISIREYLK